MSYTLILAQIESILNSVTGVENVYDYIRTEEHIKTMESLMTTTDSKIQAWFISRDAFGIQELTGASVYREHEFVLYGVYGVSDSGASEKTFQQLCDDICNKFDLSTNIAMSGEADQLKGAFLEEFVSQVEFAGKICHQARIRITANEPI